MCAAEQIRQHVNKLAGYSLIAKPEYTPASFDSNPYTRDAICFCLLPKSVADSNDKYQGDAMVGALMACVEAGVEVRL